MKKMNLTTTTNFDIIKKREEDNEMEIRKEIPCSIIRGGTSKGVYFLEKDIPSQGEERDAFLLKVMGSPDKKQIDGLGGGTSVTSKVAIVGLSSREDADVDYTFAQISVDKALVSYKGNCGNISSGVGPFAIEKGLVTVREPVTEVRIYNTNTKKLIVAEVNVKDGQVQYHGNVRIAGVPGTAAPVKLKFVNPSGTISGHLLPTGHAIDILDIPDFGEIEVSIVDAANPLVFVRARDVGMRGAALPQELDQDDAKLSFLEKVRGMAAVRLGLIDDYRRSAWDTPGVPKMTIVSCPDSYTTTDGTVIQGSEIDLLSRMMSMQKVHPTYAVTGAMCTAAAAVVPGSIVAQIIRPMQDYHTIRIGHPAGILEVGIEYEPSEREPIVKYTSGIRTANLLLEGKFIYKGDNMKTIV